MLVLVLRRARVQWRLLAAVAVLVATACTLVGTCTLVLDVTQSRGFDQEVRRTDPTDLSVTAFLVDLPGGDAAGAQDAAAAVVDEVLAPMRPTHETTTTSRLRELGEAGRTGSQAYLLATDALASRADLTGGRWPGASDGRPEVALPDTTARLLGLELGDRVALGPELGSDGAEDGVRLVVVGTFRPRAVPDWERDPLGGAGYAAAYSDGLDAAPTYGPFVVDQQALLDSGSSVNALRVTAYPTLELADETSLAQAEELLVDGSGRLGARVGERARLTRLASDLPLTLSRLHAQRASTASTVRVVLLLGVALSLAAALLTGRLVGSVREDERDLLTAMGQGRRQQVLVASAEASVLALLTAAVAVPAASLLHSSLTRRGDLAAAGLAQGPVVTWTLVVAVGLTAVLLVGALVLAALRTRPVADPSPRAGLASHAVDALLVVAAALAWWQLRAREPSSGGAGDVLLTLAPVLCLAVLSVLGVRLVVASLRGAAALAGRARGLVAPLAAAQAAQRARASTALVLVTAAVAAAVFALALRTTWDTSQDDQAALQVGTDLALALRAPAGIPDARRVADALATTTPATTTPATATPATATPATVASPVVHRPLALGRFVGRPGSRPVLVAVDTRRAGALLRGRLGAQQSWDAVGRSLAPAAAVEGLPLPEDGQGVSLRGRGPAGSSFTARVTAMVEDPTGFRAAVPAGDVALDGAPHLLRWSAPVGEGVELVAVRLELDGPTGADPGVSTSAAVTVTVSVPAVDAARAAGADAPTPDAPTPDTEPWQVRRLQEQGAVGAAAADLLTTGRRTGLRTTLEVDLAWFDYTGADVVTTVLPDPGAVPVAVSQDLVDAVDAAVGDELAAIVGGAALRLEVATIVPAVPSAPGEVAVLADTDTVSRALVHAGVLDPVVDRWWVAHPARGTAGAIAGAALGTVTTREGLAAELSRGPLRVAVPTTLLVLLALALALFAAAVVLVVGADRSRTSEAVARLRALGVPRRPAVGLQVAEHLALLVPLTLVGVLVGAASTVLVAPHLVRSDVGAAPVPTPVVAWSWPAELTVVGGLALVLLLVTWALSARVVRHATASGLRGGAS